MDVSEEIFHQLETAGKYSDILSTALALLQQHPKNPVAQYYHTTALYSLKSKDEAIERGKVYLETMEDPTWKGRLANRLGTYFWRTGDHETSKQYYDIAYDLFTQTQNMEDLGNITNNLGVYYELRGELDKAITAYQRSLTYKQQLGNPGYGTQMNMAILQRLSENYTEAIKGFTSVLKHYEMTGSGYSTALASFHLLRTYMAMDDMDKAKMYLEKIEECSVAFSEDDEIRGLVKLGEGIFLASTNNQLRDLVRAENLIREALDDNPGRYARAILSLQYLVRLKIFELKLTNNESIIGEIEALIHQMSQLATKNNAYPTHVEIQLLLAKLFDTKGEITQSLEILENSLEYIKKHNLGYLEYRIREEQQRIMEKVGAMQNMLLKNREVIDKLNQEFIEDYLRSIRI